MPRPRLLLMLVLGLALSRQAGAQLVGGLTGFCWQGGVSATTQGLPSTNKLQGIIPSCTVTVYLTGTQTLATLYADSSLTPLANPFTATSLASVAPGQWIFNAAQNAAYDVVLSGGIPPNIYHAPVTIKGLPIGLGGGGSSLPIDSVQFALANGAFGSDPNITIDPVAHAFKVAGAGTSIIEQCGGTGGACVNLTVDPSTNQWTFVWPINPPQVTSPNRASCLTAITSGTTVLTATAAFATCTQPLAFVTNPLAAPQIINAADYGAICDGQNDDTASVQTALNVMAAYNLPLTTKQNLVVQLPQGSCLITQPLVMGAHGSLVGQGDSTYLVGDYFFWKTTDSYAVIAIQVNGPLPGGASDEQRRIANMTILGINSNMYFNATGISVANLANVYSPTDYTFPNLLFDNLQISGFDTGMNIQDARDGVIRASNIDNNRIGVNFNGQVLNFVIADSEIGFGEAPPTATSGPSYGVVIQPNTKYSVNCGISVYCAPQAVDLHDTVIEGTDVGVDIAQCIACNIHHNTLDECGAGRIGSGGECVLVGQFGIGPLWVEDNWLGVETPDGFGIYSNANTTPSGSAAGFNFERNYVYGYQATTGSIGIALNGTTGGALQNGNIVGNHFRQVAHGIFLNQPLKNSIIRDNHGSLLTQSLIDLSGVSGLDHGGSLLEGNTTADSVPVIIEGSATGFRTGFNQSPMQLTGTELASGSGCLIAGGAIGGACAATITLSTPFSASDTTYSITGCQVSGSSNTAVAGTVGTTTATNFILSEVALTTSATSGGTITCQVTQN